MQLLHIIDTDDFEAWKSDFDTHTEDRMNAGLTLLQMWHGADAPGRVVCLYDSNNRGKAEAYLEKSAALSDGVSDTQHHFLRTA